MKKDRLKPYVYKVEGPVNFAFYDMLNGKFFHFSPEGSVAELREILLEKSLIFETEGVVPDKIIRGGMWEVQNNIHLRILQIRLNGRGEDYCWSRNKKEAARKYMKPETLNQLALKCRHIPIDTIRLEMETEEPEHIKYVLNRFKFNRLELYIENSLTEKQLKHYSTICADKNIKLDPGHIKNIKKWKVEIFNFFYSKSHNPCLGHQIAIDTDGTIKCCLWSDDILGDIRSSYLKDMIIEGVFDKYWLLDKNKIDSCKDCELRHACDDCRVHAINETSNIRSKPSYCNYNPYTGE
jgi:radical SAM protein with 4Fe4S-binding SPASM domain